MQVCDIKTGEEKVWVGRRARSRKFWFLLVAFAASVVFITSAFAVNETHMDKSRLPAGCISCHRGHGSRGTLMLALPKEDLCFACHGTAKQGKPGEARTDIYSVLLKRSSHPVLQTSQYHRQGETLPEKSSSATRHVSCVDCHNPHLTTKEIPFKVPRGYSGKGVPVKDVRKEYELCYLCHSDSANLPLNEHNIAQDFDRGNPSFHPVEAPGKNSRVPSLIPPLTTGSTITCSDCHGNDDRFGPQGPHGSIYDHILKANYNTEPGPESPFAYDLCYGCHNRNSILGDESFKSHKRHILYENLPCFACHASHGSKAYGNLMDFDNRIVFPNSIGQLNYVQLIPGKPRCFLNCHTGGRQYEHVMKGSQYYVNGSPVPDW